MPKFEQLALPLPKVETQKITWVFLVKYDPEYSKLLFLIAERKSNGQATFPGGKIEGNEGAASRAVKETKEETGLSIDLIWQLVPMGKILFSNAETLYDADTFLTFYEELDTLKIVNLEPEKHSFWQWIAIQDLFTNPKLHLVLKLILQSGVLDVVLETVLLELEGFKNENLPAAFMKECRNIAFDSRLKQFARDVLT